MAASQYEEIQSFLSKFMFLSQLGLNANMSLNSFCGNLCVNFNVDLGMVQQPAPFNHFKPSPQCKPSRLRRRQRRRQERGSSSNNVVTEIIQSEAETENPEIMNDYQTPPPAIEDASNIGHEVTVKTENEATSSFKPPPASGLNENDSRIIVQPTIKWDDVKDVCMASISKALSDVRPSTRDIQDQNDCDNLQMMLSKM